MDAKNVNHNKDFTYIHTWSKGIQIILKMCRITKKKNKKCFENIRQCHNKIITIFSHESISYVLICKLVYIFPSSECVFDFAGDEFQYLPSLLLPVEDVFGLGAPELSVTWFCIVTAFQYLCLLLLVLEQ